MFTGIIEELGTVRRHKLAYQDVAGQILIEGPRVAASAAIGDSVSTNGVCLTLTRREGPAFWVDYSATTAKATTIAALKVGDRVNLEQALTLSTRLGGHLVSGHVDGVGRVMRIQEGAGVTLQVAVPDALMRYLIVKGSLTVDGVSLTVGEVHADQVVLTIIPHTWAHTTLCHRRVGDAVNLEVDLIGKYVEKLLGAHQPPGTTTSPLTLSGLMDNGYR